MNIYIDSTFFHLARLIALCFLLGSGMIWTLYVIQLRYAAGQVKVKLSERLAERERIARELHDTLLQSAEMLLLRFHLAKELIPANEKTRTIMEDALSRAALLVGESRNRIRDLRSETAASATLSEAITALGDDLRTDHSMSFRIMVDGAPRVLFPLVQEEMLAVAREALTNAFGHSSGTHITVKLTFKEDGVVLQVADDGQGIPMDVMLSKRKAGHWGLSGMRERADGIRASIKIKSEPAHGTEVELRVPAEIVYWRFRSASAPWYHALIPASPSRLFESCVLYGSTLRAARKTSQLG